MFPKKKKSHNKKNKNDKNNSRDTNKSDDIFDKTSELMDMVYPDTFVEGKDFCYLGPNKYVRVYAVTNYPRQTNIGFFNDLFTLGNIDVSTYIEPIEDSHIIDRLTSKYSELKSNLNLQLKHGYAMDYGLAHAASDIDALRELIQTNKERMFFAQPIIFIWGSNLKELDNKSNALNDLCSRKSLKIRCLTLDQNVGFSSGLPTLNLSFSQNLKNVTTGSVASLIPLGNTQLSHHGGILFGRNLNTQSYIFYNNFIGAPELTNPHTFVCGTSGAGKTVFMHVKSARGTAAGRWSVILDPKGDYRKQAKELGGQYIDLKPGIKSGINPFEVEIEEDDHGKKKIDLYGKRSEIINMISIFAERFRGQPLRGQEITAVDEVVSKLYSASGITEDADSLYIAIEKAVDGKFYTGKKKKRLPILSDLRRGLIEYNRRANLKGLTELTEIMKMITGDGPMAMFDCQSSVLLENRLLVIGFKGLSDEFTKFFATINTMSWIWSKFSNWKLKDVLKDVYIDEGSLFAKYEKALDFIDNIARLGRAFHIGLTLATQFIEDFISTTQGRAIVSLCATKVLLRLEPNVARQTAEFFNLSENCRDYISSFSSGQAILLTEQDIVLMEVVPEKFEWEFSEM